MPQDQARKRFVVLDTMRGYAACIVMTLHYQYLLGTNAYMAVDFFFLLSGFVLAHAYFSRPSLNLFSFVQARFARLYPLHFVTFVVTVILYLIVGIEFTDGEFVLHLLMLHNLGLGPPRAGLNYPAWSISVEFWVNVAIGLIVVLASARALSLKSRNAILLAIAAVCYCVLLLTRGNLYAFYQDLAPLVNYGVLRGLGSIAVGVVLYDVYRWVERTYSDTTHAILQILTPIALIGFLFILVVPVKETVLDFVILALLATIVLVAAFETGPLAVLAKKFDLLGKISFSIYLTHLPVQVALKALLGDTVTMFEGYLIMVPVVLTVSYLTYTYFEVPSYAWGKRMLRESGDALERRLPSWAPGPGSQTWAALTGRSRAVSIKQS